MDVSGDRQAGEVSGVAGKHFNGMDITALKVAEQGVDFSDAVILGRHHSGDAETTVQLGPKRSDLQAVGCGVAVHTGNVVPLPCSVKVVSPHFPEDSSSLSSVVLFGLLMLMRFG